MPLSVPADFVSVSNFFSFFSQMYCHSSLIAPKLPFDCANTLLRLWLCSPSIVMTRSFDCTNSFLWFYWNVEPSTLTRRAFAIATPSARWDDNEPSATSWIQRNASVSSQIRLACAELKVLKIPKFASEKPHMRFCQSANALHQKHSLSWMCRFYVTICNTCLCFAKKTDTFAYCFALF